MLDHMRALIAYAVLAVLLSAANDPLNAQSAFEVASVRPSAHEVGPDYNNQITYSPGEFEGRNVTLRRLIAEAWQCQLKQVAGPAWLDRNEYDISARLPESSDVKQVPGMLRTLLVERFGLKAHEESRQMRAYVLSVANSGPKIQPVQQALAAQQANGIRFHGTMREFADYLAVQFSMPAPQNPDMPVRAGGPATPVLDKTGLRGLYDFNVDIRPELGTVPFTIWSRALPEQLGLKIESRQADVPVIVVDTSNKTPTEN